jgi:hypothetical protein
VSTYFFRISSNDTELCEKVLTVGRHPQLIAAKKKILRGANPQAVNAELLKRKIDPNLLIAGDSTELPLSQQLNPVAVEFTEVYLDERAFMEHAGSREYLDGYSVVMNPAMHNRTPQTTRLGTPSDNIIETILEPVLHENVAPLCDGCTIWRKPETVTSSTFLSLDFTLSEHCSSVDEAVATLPKDFKTECISCVAFSHPLRENTVRLMCVLPHVPSVEALGSLASVRPARGEVYVTPCAPGESTDSTVEDFRAMLQQVGLSEVILVLSKSAVAGYVLHEKVCELICKA